MSAVLKSLTYVEQKEKIYKEAMRRVKLLSRIRCNVSPLFAQSIYRTMIEPIVLYRNNLVLGIVPARLRNSRKFQIELLILYMAITFQIITQCYQ